MPIHRHTTRSAISTYGVPLIAFLGLLATAGLYSPAQAEADGAAAATTTEDPWRRTSNGWELVDRWNRTANRPVADGFSLRLDSHPAVLALVQSLAIVAAFALYPPRHYFR
jgi:hypothetical protein